MKCTEKEQETCRVEKLGCEGCFYYDKENQDEEVKSKNEKE